MAAIMNVRLASTLTLESILSEYEEVDYVDPILEDAIEEAEEKYDRAWLRHKYAHMEWTSVNPTCDPQVDDDRQWEAREASIFALAKARDNLADLYERAGISPEEMGRTEYKYNNDGRRIRRGYSVVSTTDVDGHRVGARYYNEVFSMNAYEAAVDFATDMAYEREVKKDEFVAHVSYEFSEKSGQSWPENSLTITVKEDLLEFDGTGWVPTNKSERVTRFYVEPCYDRF